MRKKLGLDVTGNQLGGIGGVAGKKSHQFNLNSQVNSMIRQADHSRNHGVQNATPALVRTTPIQPQVAQHPPSSQVVVATPVHQHQVAAQNAVECETCSDGAQFDANQNVCPKCRRLKPLAPGHQVPLESFQWAFDGQAMAKLRTIGPLTAMARKVSDQMGRRWVETTFNGVRVSEQQMPNVFLPAVHAARVLGLPVMPDVYVSGERPWDALTFGTDDNAFIVMGSALVGSFRGPELGFLFAREMGHILAGHALWKTVIRFLVGEHNPKRGLMKNGVMGFLDPGKWIEGAIEVPLLSWARQAEITADRAGLLALGNEAIVRRVLLAWSLKSPMLYRFINEAAWLEQQTEDAADDGIRLTEMITSSTPYITRRLKLLSDFATSSEFSEARSLIPTAVSTKNDATKHLEEATGTDTMHDETNVPLGQFSCPACSSLIRIPNNVPSDSDFLAIRCPTKSCRKVHRLKRKTQSEPSVTDVELRNLQSADD